MKKPIAKISNLADIAKRGEKLCKELKNVITEDGKDVVTSLEALIEELEKSELEFNEEALVAKLREMLDAYNSNPDEELPANVANAFSKYAQRIDNLYGKMPKSEKLTPAIKNQIAAAVLRSRGREDVQNSIDKVLVKNGITGLTFKDVIDFAINDNWGTSDELFNALRKVPFSKFFYTSQEFNDSDVVAHGWDKTSEYEKEIQALVAQGKTIATQYIYKRQQVAFEDLDSIEESGDTATFLRWLDEELDRQIVNAIIAVMLGNTTDFTDITSIESLPGAGTTDAFRTAVTVADPSAVTFTEARQIADAVATGKGFKWMVMNQTQLSALAKFKYASGGDDIFRSKEEVAAMLGVDRIYVTDKATSIICFVPDEYWVKEKNAMQVSYPKYEFNVMNYQRERNIGAAIHGLKTVAFGVAVD